MPTETPMEESNVGGERCDMVAAALGVQAFLMCCGTRWPDLPVGPY